MRKIAVLIAGVVLVGAGSAWGQAKPVFEYKGFRAGEVIPEERLEPCRPKPESEPKTGMEALLQSWRKSQGVDNAQIDRDYFSCSDFNAKVAGFDVTSEFIGIYKERLSSVTITFDAPAFKLITDAFKAKYGPPCTVNMNRVQNRMGASFPSPRYEWCFSRGRLVADMYYPTLDTSTATWEDPANQPPKATPKVDF